jgi:exodeoxyribonuclease VIII
MNIDPHDSRRLGFKENFDTMLWWMWQSKAAQNAVLDNPKPLMEVFGEFSKFAKEAEDVWSHATFDFAIVTEAYKSVGLELPFHYKTSRDLRTICKLAKIDLKNHIRVGVHHNGLDDCITQVGYTVECLKKLKAK